LRPTTPGRFPGRRRSDQRYGLSGLHFLMQLGLGACLADDTALGKTVQVIALLTLKRERKPVRLVLDGYEWTTEGPVSLRHLWKLALHELF
jgi:SNF2 family DNA or RNA helicase